MHRGRIKVYTYTRVSTAMQTDGYSLSGEDTDAGKRRHRPAGTGYGSGGRHGAYL